jgi:GNAT superfamily N-acetyltransferase
MIEVHPLTTDRWADLEALFGPRGAVGGCWCMWWRLSASQFRRDKGGNNKAALSQLVVGGETPGLLAYDDGSPVGWCSVAPRQSFPRLEGSRVLKPVDASDVWSVICFFVARGYRNRGLGSRLLSAACSFASDRGAKVLEGYPVEPRSGHAPDTFVYTGVPSMFRSAGFEEVARRSPGRPIMRKRL